LDGAPARRQENIVERAVERALADSVEVLLVRTHAAELERHGSVAALLRY
jgi:hypothetical protein